MRATDASASPGLDTTALRVAPAIAEHADERPETVAVVDGDSRLTYARLAARAEAVRTSLVERGVGAGDRVALVLPPGCAQVAAVVGVLAAGAAYVPIDPEEPAARRAHILADADPVLTVVDSATHLGSVDGSVHIGDLDIATADDTAPLRPAPVADDEPIYVMYTSGTTGDPKGVALTHGGVGNLLHALVERCRLDDVGAVLMRTRFSFDASVPELLLPLAFGKTIVVAPDGRDLPAVLDLVAQHHVQMVTMVPSLTAALLTSGAPLGALAGVRRWLSVGEALPARTARDLLERASAEGSPMQLFNMYGPTEASVFLSGGRVFEEDVRTGLERVRLGRPLRNYRVHVLVPGSLTAVAPRGSRRDLRRGSRRRARVPRARGQPGVHRGADHRAPDVPHRRPRMRLPGRHARLPRPTRRPGEDPWAPCRARRGRCSARRVRGRRRRRVRRRPRRTARHARRRRRPRGPGSRDVRSPRCARRLAARPDDPDDDRRGPRAPNHSQREAGPRRRRRGCGRHGSD
ncbi:AMP-binding protein [Curtobacterium flaccumfaciens pv. flaccumfaciens]